MDYVKDILDLKAQVTALEAEISTLQTEWDTDIADLVKHCACEWEGEEPRTPTITCAYHQKLERDLAMAKALLVLVHYDWENIRFDTWCKRQIQQMIGPITDADIEVARKTVEGL